MLTLAGTWINEIDQHRPPRVRQRKSGLTTAVFVSLDRDRWARLAEGSGRRSQMAAKRRDYREDLRRARRGASAAEISPSLARELSLGHLPGGCR